MHSIDTSTPALVLAGQENALAITRNLGRHGIDVHVSGAKSCWAIYSRYCKEAHLIPLGANPIEFWRDLLLGPKSERLHGLVLVPCNDDALEFVAAHENALRRFYILEDFDAALHKALLDKQATVELANKAGVPAPKQYPVKTVSDVKALRGKIKLPALVKALNTHAFNRALGSKVLVADESFEQLCAHAQRAFDANQQIMIVEMIPGGDDQLCSYFTYITPDGDYLFDFTKSVVRRYPVGYGSGACHVTKWQPDVVEMGRRFFESVDFRGIGNIEFKRDGDQLKIIEVNTRFAASHELIVQSGAPIDLIVYCYLTKQSIPKFKHYEQNRYLWAPITDTLSFLELHRRGKISFRAWVTDLLRHRITFPIFRITDPYPSLRQAWSLVQKLGVRVTQRILRHVRSRKEPLKEKPAANNNSNALNPASGVGPTGRT